MTQIKESRLRAAFFLLNADEGQTTGMLAQFLDAWSAKPQTFGVIEQARISVGGYVFRAR